MHGMFYANLAQSILNRAMVKGGEPRDGSGKQKTV